MTRREKVTIGDTIQTLTRNGVHPMQAFQKAAWVTPSWNDDGRAYLHVNGQQWYVHEKEETP